MTYRQTSAENLKDLIRNLGEQPKGNTVADLLDQLETILPGGGGEGGGTVVTEGSLDGNDIDWIFIDEISGE